MRWGEDHPVPGKRPSWLGPDIIAITTALREEVDQRFHSSVPTDSAAQAVVNELAQHHAHDMAERSYCGSEDPEGAGLPDRLARLHPSFVGQAIQWQRELDVQPGWDEHRIATELLDESGTSERLSGILDWGRGNCIGVAVAVSEHRIVACLVAGSSWARLQKVGQGEAEPDTWLVGGQLTEGISADSMQFTLRSADGEESEVQGPFPTTEDDWEEGRFRLLLPLLDELSEATLVAEQQGERSYPVPLP